MPSLLPPGASLIRPFVAQAPQAVLDDLRARIRHTRWPTSATEAGWANGTNLAVLQQLASYWAEQFDWRHVEAASNAYPNFLTEIDGQDIHFLHVKGKEPNAIPLIISHGWPGSFLELLKLIPLFTA